MTLVLGHQGAPRLAPANTLDAFAAACGLGADGVELDVRRTADGALVVHHDPALDDGRVLAQTRRAELPDWVPDLEAVLEVCEGRLVNVEVKHLPGEPDHDPHHGPAGDVARLLLARGGRDRVVVSSFDHAAVDHVHELAPELPTGLLGLVPMVPEVVAEMVSRCAERGHGALHPHEMGVDADLVARCHAAGLAVNTWTVDEPDRVAELGRLGVDVIISNVPDVALAALGR